MIHHHSKHPKHGRGSVFEMRTNADAICGNPHASNRCLTMHGESLPTQGVSKSRTRRSTMSWRALSEGSEYYT